MKIRGQSRVFPLIFFDSEESKTDWCGNDESIKYRNRRDGFKEDIYVFSDKNNFVTNINYLKFTIDKSSDIVLSTDYIMQIEIYLSNILETIGKPFNITSSMTDYKGYTPIISSNISISPIGYLNMEKFQEIVLPENLYGIKSSIRKENFTVNMSNKKMFTPKITTITSYMNYNVEDSTEYVIEDGAYIYNLVYEAFEIIQQLKIKQSEIGYVILFGELKEILEKLNTEYINMESVEQNKTLTRILSR